MRQKILSMLLCVLLFTGLFSGSALASTDWPSDVAIEADAGIVMDARTGTVLYGKNIHETYSPASITKVLTALIVLEHCSLDETVSFSQNAVYNVESNSSSAGYDTGDTASVKDCLYALLLKSANESANALAEHLCGSTEEFARLMNEKAAELGCQDSHFSNPSGLNDENHYVSAYDMALITRAAFENEEFSKIVATTYYELPPNKKNPEGQGISPGNKMIKKNWPGQYRPDVIGGKTGYTSIALNTLVIGAQQGDTKLITAVLHSQGTQYDDTKRLLDFGFANFQSIKISDFDQTFSSIGGDLKIAGLPTSKKRVLTLDPDSRIVLPKTADFSETTVSLDYTVPAGAPEGAIACVNYLLGDHPVGQAYLTLTSAIPEAGETLPQELLEVQPSALTAEGAEEPSHLDGEQGLPGGGRSIDGENGSTGSAVGRNAGGEPSAGRNAGGKGADGQGADAPENPNGPDADSPSENGKFHISFKLPSLFWKLLAGAAVLGAGGTFAYFTIKKRREKEEAAVLERRRRRAERLKETGISEAEFDLMIQARRRSQDKGSSKRSFQSGQEEDDEP